MKEEDSQERTNNGKDLEDSTCLECCRNSEEASVAGLEAGYSIECQEGHLRQLFKIITRWQALGKGSDFRRIILAAILKVDFRCWGWGRLKQGNQLGDYCKNLEER